MKRIYYYIFSFSFLLIISAPFWGIIFQKDLGETKPDISNLSPVRPTEMISELNNYASYHHGFRPRMTYEYLSFVFNNLKESPIPSKAIVGKDDWFFLGNEYADEYSSALGVLEIDSARVDSVCWNINQLKVFCESIGVDFYLTIAPNKSSIYPEYLPLKPNMLPRFKDHVLKRLVSRYGVEVSDLSEPILSKKDSAHVYYKYDSHWNQYGAFVATEYLVDVIKEKHDLPSIREEDFLFKKFIRDDGDIGKMFRLDCKEEDCALWTKSDISLADIIVQEKDGCSCIKNKIGDNKLSALVIRDSFFTLVVNLFSTRLNEMAFFPVEYLGDEVVIRKERILESLPTLDNKPDFILVELAERNLLNFRFDD